MACRIPSDRFLALPVKKLTVIGIIGNTQGVSNAARPAKKASTIKPQSEAISSSPANSSSVEVATGAESVVTVTVESVPSVDGELGFASSSGASSKEAASFWRSSPAPGFSFAVNGSSISNS